MKTESFPPTFLQQAAQIPQMERGKLSVIREGPDGPYFNHQVRKDGKNVSRYVPRDQVPAVQAALDGYQKFQGLVDQHVDQIVDQTRREIASGSKKSRAPVPGPPRPGSRNPAVDGPL